MNNGESLRQWVRSIDERLGRLEQRTDEIQRNLGDLLSGLRAEGARANGHSEKLRVLDEAIQDNRRRIVRLERHEGIWEGKVAGVALALTALFSLISLGIQLMRIWGH